MSIHLPHSSDGSVLNQTDGDRHNNTLNDQLPWGLFSLDSRGFFVYRNTQAADLCTNAHRVPLTDLTTLLDDEAWRSLSEDGTIEYDVQLDGRSIWLRFKIRRLHPPVGNALFVGTVEDVTQEKQKAKHGAALDQLHREIWRMESPEDISNVLATVHRYLSTLQAPVANYGVNIVSKDEFRFHSRDVQGHWRERPSFTGDDIVRRIWQSGRTTYRPDLDKEDSFGERAGIDALFGAEVRSIVDVPFSHGTLALNSRTPNAFNKADIAFLEAIAEVLSEGFRRQADLQALAHKDHQLRQAQKLEAMGLLAGGVAHDFNNLITIVSGYSQMLLYELDTEDPRRASVAEICEASQRAETLVQQLMLFSHRKQADIGPIDLNQVVTGLERMLPRLIGEDIIISNSLAPDLRPVLADHGQLEQVLMNLAINARDAMPDGGRLHISTASTVANHDFCHRVGIDPKAYAQLSIRDNGAGMDSKTQTQIFEPFFTTKPQGQGTGLGLAIVYGIVKESKGEIEVSSNPGEGTCITIYLPTCERAVPQKTTDPLPIRTDGGPETILLVEDDDMVRRLTRRFLAENGYNVLEATSGDSALSLFENHAEPISLLLTDVIMPGMNGRDLGEALSTQDPALKVIYMSGYTDHTIERRGLRLADETFLQKPFTADLLAYKVRRILDGD